jgi:hypothetical protein
MEFSARGKAANDEVLSGGSQPPISGRQTDYFGHTNSEQH